MTEPLTATIEITADVCPFCEWHEQESVLTKHSEVAVKDGFPEYSNQVICPGCGAQGPYGEDLAEAVQLWNKAKR